MLNLYLFTHVPVHLSIWVLKCASNLYRPSSIVVTVKHIKLQLDGHMDRMEEI